MHLCAVFLILNIQLIRIFAFPPNPFGLSLQDNFNPKGYECGNVFFNDCEVKRALLTARASIDKAYQYPQKYRGNLYIESKFEEYFIYPIREGSLFQPQDKAIKTVFYIVLTRDNIDEAGVVAKLPSGDYTKCKQRGSTHIGPSNPAQENQNGYLCAHNFFTDETIQESLALAQKRDLENTMYPCAYVGSLYPEHSGLLMWPIMKGKILYKHGKAHVGPYFLLLSQERKLIDVVIRGYNKNVLRCIRSRKSPKTPVSDPFTKLFAPAPRSGYVCGKRFFDDNVLKESAEIAKSKASSTFPIEYFGPPFNQQCLIWPIWPDGSLLKSGVRGRFRLILTPDFEVMNVAMHTNGIYMVCERNKIIANKDHDTSSYLCNNKKLTHEQLVMAAYEACEKMNSLRRYSYPATYVGSRFEKQGPYLTYPVTIMRQFRFNAGLHRVVINTNCEVVGALTILNSVTSRKMVKCHRLDDGPLPPDFFGANAEEVYEHKVRY